MGQTIKQPKFDKGIGEAILYANTWKNYMGRICNGVMSVCVDGEWLLQKDFLEKYPKPFNIDFLGDPTNPDNTKAYLHK